MKKWLVGTCIVLQFFATNQAQSSVIRLQTVVIPADSGLLAELLPEFERATGYRVDVNTAEQVYTLARQGAADLVLSHYGHSEVDDFMADGLGLWPRTVFASQSVLLGPAGDPAGIRGIQDAAEAFRRIAQTKSQFVVNNAATEKYLAQVLFEAAGRPDPAGWYADTGLSDQPAIQAAQRTDGYVLWGIIPFLRFKEMTHSPLEGFVFDDPVFQRVMMTVIVNSEAIRGVNVAGAAALQRYLSSPAAQARIRAFRYPGVKQQLFWPAGYDNIGSFLTDSSPLPKSSDPNANSVVLSPATIRAGDRITATFTGANLSTQTYFDVRFRRPGGTSDDLAQNWQQNTSGTHAVPAGTAAGTWRVTGVRAHTDANDHSASVIPVTTNLAVLP